MQISCAVFRYTENSDDRFSRVGAHIMSAVSLRDREVPGLIPGRDIPKSLTMVLVAPRLALRFLG